MIVTDEASLVCDLAETYQIYDYKSLPLSKVATFSVGLRENSRIKMKMNDMKIPIETMLMAMIADALALLVWTKTTDGMKGISKPKSILATLQKQNEEKDIEAFDTSEDFTKEWKRRTGGK